MAHWNRTYNLTAVTTRAGMVTHHLLDSLAIHPELRGERVADVGTGAGFPGLPLALVNPARHFTLIDSVGKKVRFVAHAVRTLGLGNVEALQVRAESLIPAQPFDTVTARAFAPLPKLLTAASRLCTPAGQVLAMKGKWPQEELAALPSPWRLAGGRQIAVPGLAEARCVLVLRQDAAAAPSSP
ncbi:MAG: 16S rRNA (guanine(527)-N(7))-methyltransferase RsmG [Steroidobacteraceae bacterium]